jgi:hypothetical protein
MGTLIQLALKAIAQEKGEGDWQNHPRNEQGDDEQDVLQHFDLPKRRSL